MPAGLQIFNSSGSVQITDSYQNLQLKTKSTISISDQPVAGWNIYQATLTVTANRPILLFGQSSQPVAALVSAKSGNSWTFTLSSPSPHTVTYYLFDTGLPMGSSKFGLQVWNSAGAPVFDSGNQGLRLHAVHQMGSGQSSFSVPNDGRSFAAGMSYSRIYRQQIAPQWGGVFGDGSKLTASLVEGIATLVGIYPIAAGYGGAPSWAYYPQLIVADVTGY